MDNSGNTIFFKLPVITEVKNQTKQELKYEAEKLTEKTVVTEKSEPTEKKKITRCQAECCRRKLGVVVFDCRCGKVFCGEHRLSENHNCNFDYRALHKKELLKFMSTPIISEKVPVI